MTEEIDRTEPALHYRALAQALAWAGVIIGFTRPTMSGRLAWTAVGFGSAIHVYERGQEARRAKEALARERSAVKMR